MALQRVLVTVKTYPTLSRKHGETVCTAGVREDGSWVRIYPVPFRRLDERQQFHKFDWLECDLVQSRRDPRPETRHPADMTRFKVVGHIGTDDNWRERRELLLKRATALRTPTGAKANWRSWIGKWACCIGTACERPMEVNRQRWRKCGRSTWTTSRRLTFISFSAQRSSFILSHRILG